MVTGLKYIENVGLALVLLLLSACEPLYDPTKAQDVPTSPGSTWNKKPIIVKETTERPYSVADLSGSMPLSRLLDIALNNNPLTRVSWNAARASA